MKQKTCSKNTGNPSWIEVSKRIAFLIDFHKMTVSVLKSHFSKQKSNIVSYRIYKSFRNNSFRNELCDLCKIEYRHFLNIFWIFWINMLPSKKIVSEQMKVTLCRELAKPSWKGLNCTIDPWKKKVRFLDRYALHNGTIVLIFWGKLQKQPPEACNFIKKETLAHLFSCEFREIFKNTFLYRTPPVAASEYFCNTAENHYQKILLLRSRQLNSLLTLWYLHWKNIKIIQA